MEILWCVCGGGAEGVVTVPPFICACTQCMETGVKVVQVVVAIYSTELSENTHVKISVALMFIKILACLFPRIRFWIVSSFLCIF